MEQLLPPFARRSARRFSGVPRAFRAKRRPDVYERSLAWRAVGSLEVEPLYHASLDGAEYRALLDAHGFNVVAHVTEDPTCGGLTIWLAQLR